MRGWVALGHGLEPLSDINYTWEQESRNKRSVTVELADERGVEIVHRLVKTADVFVSNLRDFLLKRHKLDYETLSEVNSGIVWANLTGYGLWGPDKDRPGFDYAAGWARSGLANILGVSSVSSEGKLTTTWANVKIQN